MRSNAGLVATMMTLFRDKRGTLPVFITMLALCVTWFAIPMSPARAQTGAAPAGAAATVTAMPTATPTPTGTGSGVLTFVEAGPIQLDSGNAGKFTIKNSGNAPLTVTSVYARTTEKDPRIPGTLTATFDGGATKTDIAPGQTKVVNVKWDNKNARLSQLFAHVVVESTDGAVPQAAMGIVAQPPSGNIVTNHILSWMTFLPLLGLLLIVGLHFMKADDHTTRYVALAITAIQCAMAIWLYKNFDPTITRADGNDGFQFIEHMSWVPGFSIEYFIGVDGLSITMVILTALVSFVGVLASFSIEKQLKGYFAMYLLLVTGMMGTFVAVDLFLFFVFWEVMLLPMYFLIGIWGGPRKEYAAIKFFLYTLAGSVLMLLAIIALYLNAEPTYLVDGTRVLHTFSVPELMRVDFLGKGLTILGMSFVKVVWIGFFIGFAIKIPMFPFHTWLPDAHVEAPTAISVILAGVLLKMGTYGILRFNFAILPEATRWAAPAMAVLGVINILYGAFCAMAQEDLKKLVAYSSVSHMGYCLLGMAALTPQGIAGCLTQMFAHGIITSMLFTLVGVVYDRVHTRDLSKFGGLAGEMPVYTAFVGFAFMASLGLPGLAGFVAEILTFVGAFPVYRVLTILAATGVIITAAYHLWALQRIFLGKFNESWRSNHYLEPFGGKFPEINAREVASLIPLAVLVLYLGFYPKPLLDMFQGALTDLSTRVNPANVAQVVHDTGKAFAAVQP
jgi:NADH-quinone oxidoreductase subunit M